MKRAVFLSYVFIFLLMVVSSYAADNWVSVADRIDAIVKQALQSYENGKVTEAMEMVADAYFGIFEGEKANMEIAVRRYLSLKKATELEKGFGDIRKAMYNKAPLLDIKKQIANLLKALKESAMELDRKGVEMDAGFSSQ